MGNVIMVNYRAPGQIEGHLDIVARVPQMTIDRSLRRRHRLVALAAETSTVS
jgi:hypothetical protein